MFTQGKAVSEAMKGLEPREAEKVIWKKQPGSYAGTDLQTWLDGRGVRKVVLVGYMVGLFLFLCSLFSVLCGEGWCGRWGSVRTWRDVAERGSIGATDARFQAHVCVSTTARQASELGYDVVLVEDAIGDRDIPGISGEEVSKVGVPLTI